MARLNRHARWNDLAKTPKRVFNLGQLANGLLLDGTRLNSTFNYLRHVQTIDDLQAVSFPHEQRCRERVHTMYTEPKPSINLTSALGERIGSRRRQTGVPKPCPASPENQPRSRAHGPRSYVLTSEWSHDRDAAAESLTASSVAARSNNFLKTL